jgi:hypothetical protein
MSMPATLTDVWIAVIALLVVVAVVAGSALGARYALQRRNRVITTVKSPVPLGWLTSNRREARIHRRLRTSGRRLELVPPTDDVADIITRLRIELVELDAYLVTVARRPSKARRADRPQLYERVEQIEELVHRVEERSRAELVSLDELSERLDLLEAADEELNELGPG